MLGFQKPSEMVHGVCSSVCSSEVLDLRYVETLVDIQKFATWFMNTFLALLNKTWFGSGGSSSDEKK